MSRKREDFELVTIKKKGKAKPKFEIHHKPKPPKEESHYQCLSTTNREEPEQFMNATRKQETEPVLLEPEVYMNITHAKKEAQHSIKLSQEPVPIEPEQLYMNITHPEKKTLPKPKVKKRTGNANTDKVTPALAHHHSTEILKQVMEEHRNTTGSDTESDTCDITPASSPQQSGRYNTYISNHNMSTKTKSSSPPLKSDVSTLPAMHSVVAVEQSRNHPDTAPGDGDLQSLASSISRKKDGRGSRNKCLIVVCCVLVAFLVFTLLLTFVWLNRSELEKNQAEDSHSTATSNMLIMNLTKQVRDLEESLKMETYVAIRNLNASLIQMKMERDAAIGSLNESLSRMKMERDAAIGILNASLSQMKMERDAAIGSLNVNFTNQVGELEVSLRNLDGRLSTSIDSHSSRLDTADTNLQLMINTHISEYSSLVSTSENNYSRLATRISGNYVNLTDRITHLQDSVNTANFQLQNGVNLESRCNRGIENCNVTGEGSVYQLSCETSSIPRTTSVSHTCQQ